MKLMGQFVILIAVLFALVGCQTKVDTPSEQAKTGPTNAPKSAEAKPAEAKKAADKSTAQTEETKADPNEIVFDPRTPPPGFTTCHRNHCHRVGGGVASYKQVMEEIGATKIVGVPKQAPMPKAPSDYAGPSPDAVVTSSGLAYKVLTKGSGGPRPKATSVVVVHYTGWLTSNGQAFDSSVARGQPATFPLNRVFPGWTEGLQLMTVGEERRFSVPEHLAFQGRKGAPPGMLVFDVELLEIKE